MSAHAALPDEATESPIESAKIPDKLFFRIGEAAEICGVQPYVLRFWESEFKQLKPTKGSGGQRMYRRKDVETALAIKRLVHEEGYTIAGAREKLKGGARAAKSKSVDAPKTPTPTVEIAAPVIISAPEPVVAPEPIKSSIASQTAIYPVINDNERTSIAQQEMAQARSILSAISLDDEPSTGDLFSALPGVNVINFPAAKVEAPSILEAPVAKVEQPIVKTEAQPSKRMGLLAEIREELLAIRSMLAVQL